MPSPLLMIRFIQPSSLAYPYAIEILSQKLKTIFNRSFHFAENSGIIFIYVFPFEDMFFFSRILLQSWKQLKGTKNKKEEKQSKCYFSNCVIA